MKFYIYTGLCEIMGKREIMKERRMNDVPILKLIEPDQ